MGLKILSGHFKTRDLICAKRKGVQVPKRWGLRRIFTLFPYETVAIQELRFIAQRDIEHQHSNALTGCSLGLLLNWLIGPWGLLIGALSGSSTHTSRSQEITFSCRLVDGREFMAVCDSTTYQQFLVAANFSQNKRR